MDRHRKSDGVLNHNNNQLMPHNQLNQQQHQQQQHQHHHQQQQYTYQQQPQGSWTPNITAPPFYPSFYQGQQQSPYFDPANAQLAAQWAYQQMMFNAQHGFQQPPPQQRQNQPQDYFAQSVYNPFPSGTPPPPPQQQYPQGFHPYRRPNRQQSTPDDWRPPYGRPDASASSSSLNSSSSSRQRTNSNQSTRSASTAPQQPRSPQPTTTTTTTTTAPSIPTRPHHRNLSNSSSTSTATTTSRPSALTPVVPTTSTSSASASSATSPSSPSSSSSSSVPRLNRPSPLSQGTFTASEKRMSRDDIDLGTLQLDAAHRGDSARGPGLKSRLKRALSFNAAQTLKEEEAILDEDDEDDDDDDESIKASALNGKLKPKPSSSSTKPSPVSPDNASGKVTPSPPTPTPKKKSRAASLFNSRMNMSTDNISLSSTVSSASVMIRKLGAMGNLARRNSLAGITSLFKDKKNKEDKDKKGKSKDKKSVPTTAKAVASQASVSHVTAELDRMGSDWSATDMNGLSPAAKLARQHTLKSNAEAAAKAKADKEAAAAAAAAAVAAAAAAATSPPQNGIVRNGVNGQQQQAGVPTWDRNTATRQSPAKSAASVRVNEDGTRTLIEDEEDESDDGHYRHNGFHADGWDDDEEWDAGPEEEDATIRASVDLRSSEDSSAPSEMEPWAVDLRRSVERTRKPPKGILKYAEKYDQQVYLHDHAGTRVRSNSYNSPAQTELGPLARIPSPDPDHIDGLHRHGSHSSGHSNGETAPSLPPLSFDSSSPINTTFNISKDLPSTPSGPTPGMGTGTGGAGDRSSAIYQHPNFNSSAPTLTTMKSVAPPPTLTHRSATAPSKRLAFASNLSVYDTFSANVYDRRSEPATWSRLTPALAQRIKEELNSYKMEEMEVHAASRIHTQFFV